MKFLIDWLDQRTGARKLLHEALYENVPGGARWRYVWGSTLTFTLAVQFITGIFLWMGYSPSAQTAWESVNYIQNNMAAGWLLRGLHHFTAQAMTILLVLHLMQVIIDGAYKAPRELNFWFGLLLLMLVLGLSLTGYLLPWDQKGFWASKVATSLMGLVPFVGHALQKIVIGGTDYGHLTLTRFFALHAGVLPAGIVLLLVVHIYLFRKHGITARDPKRRPDTTFWPDQVLMDSVACLAVLAAVMFFILKPKIFGVGGALGAELGAPADPTEPYSAARPEWYFLFLFQFLKLKIFAGDREIWGAIVIPSLAIGVLFAMPFLGRWKLGHRFNLGFLGVVLTGAVWLTYQAKSEDAANKTYQVAVKAAEKDAERVKVLAASPEGIPTTGAITLLRNDPYTQGPRLFARHCAACHAYGGGDAMGNPLTALQSGADLKDFGSRPAIAGFVDPTLILTTNYFGGTKAQEGKMAKFVAKVIAKYDATEKEQLRKVVMALSAEAGLPSQKAVDERDAADIKEGANLLKTTMRCAECHTFHGKDENATAVDLTGYASREWLIRIIANPGHPEMYGKHNDRMPAFGEKQILTATEMGFLADWLRGEWYRPSNRAE